MANQSIAYTVLPKGAPNDRLKLSVFVSPRLDPGVPNGMLGMFPQFWNPGGDHWPGVINARKFELEFRIGGGSVFAKTILDGPKADPSIWAALFKKTTTVRGHAFQDMSTRFIHSYSVRSVFGYVRDLYGKVAGTTPTEFPKLRPSKDDSSAATLQDLIDRIGAVATNERWKRTPWNPASMLRDQRQRALDAAKFNQYGFASKEELAFAQVNRFYERPRKGNAYREKPDPGLAGVPKRLAVPKPDFHEMLSALGDYPSLMRMIGMVIDLEVVVPDGTAPGALAGADAVRVRVAGASEYSPWTKLQKPFVAKPRPTGDISDGMLRADNADLYDLVQVDMDSMGMKTLHFAGNMRKVDQGRAQSSPTITNMVIGDRQSLPTLRTSGIAVAKYNRAFRMADHLINAAANNSAMGANAPVEVWADDLVRGYRVDAWDDGSGKWHSLCRRDGRYVFTEASHDALAISDEGYIKGASATSTNDGLPTDQDLYLHENLFQWDGWSLAAPRPGRTIIAKTYDDSGNPLPHQEETVAKPTSTAVTELKLEVAMRPTPGTLPRLRFGRTYKMRARTVDLAGNSVPPEPPPTWDGADPTWIAQPAADHASQPILYGRFEPVPSPAIVPRTAFGEGESAERMVIRSNFDKTPEQYIEQDYVKNAIAGKWYAYAANNERHLAPPKTSQLTAEIHGQFDDAIGKGLPHDAAFKIAVKEAGTFLDTTVVDTATGDATIPATGIALVTPPSVPKPHAVLPGTVPGAGEYELKTGDALAAGQYVVHNTDKLVLPYLPDPFARGAALRGLPGVTTTGNIAGGLQVINVAPGVDGFVLRVPFDGDWPNAQPFRLRIVEGTGAPEWKADERLLVVPVPKGRTAKVPFSSYLGKDPKTGAQDFKLMGITQWASDPSSQIVPYAAAGSHWMLTPWRVLEMVHAVQQPLKEAEFNKSAVVKWRIGDTYVDIFGFINLDAPSTGKVEVLAEWFDPTDSTNPDTVPDDDPGAPGSERYNRRSGVFSLNIDEDAPDHLTIHCPDVDGLTYLNQASLKDFPGVAVPNVKDGSAAKLAAEMPTVIDAKTPTPELKGGLMKEADAKLGAKFKFKAKDDDKDLMSPLYAPRCRHEFNDTKHRFVNYRVVGTTRYREYFPTEIVRDEKNITRVGPAWEKVNILSSARPDAPKVLYVVPTFGWEEKKIGEEIVSRRCGNGLRVYLDRPWYSSGIGELLGVVLRAPSGEFGLLSPDANGGNDPLKPFVTDVGMDPIWGSEFTKSSLKIGDFPLATYGQTDVTLDELPGVTVAVAGHPVDFDPERKLWYCDIEIDAGNSYYPFVRLALCRYQPDSIPDAHISRVMQADFAQLAPDRVAAVLFDEKDDKKVRVFVSGVYGVSHIMHSPNVGVQLNQYRLGSTNDQSILAAQAATRLVQVAVETKMPGAGPDAPWYPVDAVAGKKNGPVVLAPVSKVDAKMVWAGEITLPEAPKKPDSKPYRLVITEAEVLPVDGPGVPFGAGTMQNPGMRVVYADVIEL